MYQTNHLNVTPNLDKNRHKKVRIITNIKQSIFCELVSLFHNHLNMEESNGAKSKEQTKKIYYKPFKNDKNKRKNR